jgi:hypothetical protein
VIVRAVLYHVQERHEAECGVRKGRCRCLREQSEVAAPAGYAKGLASVVDPDDPTVAGEVVNHVAGAAAHVEHQPGRRRILIEEGEEGCGPGVKPPMAVFRKDRPTLGG